MKITENEVEVVKHQSVNAPLLLLLLFGRGSGVCVVTVINACKPTQINKTGAKTNGMLFQTSKKTLPLRCAQIRPRMMEGRLTSSDESNKHCEMGRKSRRNKKAQTFIMPSQLVVNVACSVGAAAADVPLRYSSMEIAAL